MNDQHSRMNIQQPAAPTCAPFDPQRFARLMAIDATARWVGAAAIATCIVFGPALGLDSATASLFAVFAITVIWVMLSNTSARVWRRARSMPALIEQDPPQAEALLAELIDRKPLQRQVRLGLLHRLAMLRHRQQRYAETDAICRTLLDERLDPSQRIGPHLLLMLVEANLMMGLLAGAYQGLVELSRTSLNLVESLQRLALQTRYELAAGDANAALYRLPHKVALSELMPASQCGAMHLMLAQAADRTGRQELAQWLTSRAELIGGKSLEAMMHDGGFLQGAAAVNGDPS